MAYNPRPQEGKIISHAVWKMLKAREEVDDENIKLKPIPSDIKPLTSKVQYSIIMRKFGSKSDEILQSVFKTANLKNIIRLILKADHSILFLERSHDGKVIWDKQ